MTTVGTYAFTASDYRELDFPVDLWLEHSLKIFDKVSLVYIAKELRAEDNWLTNNHNDKLILTILPYEPNTSIGYSLKAAKIAQEALDTDWKLSLCTDEFMVARPIFDGLSDKYAYVPVERNLWGNIFTEIVGGESYTMVAIDQARFHYGNANFTGDGGDVALPKAYAPPSFNHLFYHTGYCRNPKALSARLKTKVRNELLYGIQNNRQVLQFTDQEFDYRNFRLLWPHSELKKVDPSELPKILLDNAERFHQIDF
jgi:hypothetical protein